MEPPAHSRLTDSASPTTEMTEPPSSTSGPSQDHVLPDRRQFLEFFSAAGAGTLFPGVLWAQAQEDGEITTETIRAAETIAGIEFTPEEREQMLEGLNERLSDYSTIAAVEIPNSVPPAFEFNPVPTDVDLPSGESYLRLEPQDTPSVPSDLEQLAFEPVTVLAEHLRAGNVSSVDLTKMYLTRLRRHDPELNAVVTYTEDLAMKQAERADEELARGLYRGPLHGIPWGAKDLVAVDGYPTTWGARPYKNQDFDFNAAVVDRLTEAGAVLIAKLSLGALASGDVWFGGKTRNPWNLEEGSSGSSAGPAAATVAGLVGFGIGSETMGSIISPSNRTGATGLRPTFGRVSRDGAMTLSWTHDKLGPICRSVEDCAVVLDVISGPDGWDRTARDLPFQWDASAPLDEIRVGYYRSAFEAEHETKPFDDEALNVLDGLGVDLTPVEFPDDFPIEAIEFLRKAEEAAAFDQLTRSGRDDLMEDSKWPNVFREGQLIPAVQYIQANRIRMMIIRSMQTVFSDVDVVVTPTYGENVLALTNLTGHPALVLPNGFESDQTPISISFIGSLYREGQLLRVGKAYQDATGFHEKTPPKFT